MDESGAGPGNGNGNGGPHVKRTRILLSCSVCRNSKLKCDRAQPCGQCLKKCKPSACEYAPKPEKHKKQAKGMAARLKRLEGMVKGMIDSESLTRPADAPDEPTAAGGQVIRGDRATSYVGGTHFMAILEDIDELKSYFEVPEDEETEDLDAYEEAAGSPELLLFSRSAPRNRDELLALLPEKSVIDRLMMRYFNSNSPSQHILHKPTFSKEYQQFWQDPSKTSYHWLACLFMVISLGVFFSSFQAPHELDADSSSSSPTGAGTAPSAMDRFRQYRNAGGTALVWGKYSRPNNMTLQAFLLYVEGDFMVNRDTQMNCYLLSSVLIRLMLKMGLHRDPSKLPNISPYDGEMRRRYWNLAIQIDLLVSFHLGLPSMIHGIESDTLLPRNLIDEDFDEESRKLPLARPAADYTPLTYPINKAALCRVFGLVARQAHALTVPGYAEVMRVDGVLECTWSQVPGFMKVKPMEESVMDPPLQVVQRFGLASIYQKSRCVLHRRYLTEANPKREHAYSRKTCLEAALALLDYQSIIYGACKPGAMLSHMGWFMSSLAINDFLLADMIVSLVLQSENYPEFGGDSDLMMQVSILGSDS
ncbi:fungal-specific transcription factor domain-containing protein [Pseudomassariella vexata]|uniref:Fungal-specific transcription factor domain-domain-containing protein n=1 Tax=Pseudomassariella vexata TaxID=1141098 RepID=A0A1Y2EI04_9PEZI|nr:fungal-specific transcription factor domain-containing protein [Pseudomassariella vexata]ORY71200.1 fungal-specific transcription factor domain-domain-containing protein [Pseudomassariella vexata]